NVLHVPHLSDLSGHHHVGHVDAGHGPSSHAGHGGHADAHHHEGHRGDGETEGARFSLLQYLNPMAVAGFLLGFGGTGVFFGIAKPDMHTSVRMALAIAAGSSLWLMTYL